MKKRSLFLALALFRPAAASPPDTLAPLRVLERFDSLLDAGAEKEARALCTGTALRMFSFLLEAQRKLAPFLDSAKSRDTVIEEKQKSKWCALKTVSDAVFRRPLMGLDRVHSVQAMHLYRKPEGWRLAEFEELNDEKTPLILRSGLPLEIVDTASSLFPVSHKAPEQRGLDRLRLKVSMRNGDSLNLPEGPGQKVIRTGKGWVEVETFRGLGERDEENTKIFLASSPYLDLGDSLLLSKVAELRQGTKSETEIVRRIYGFVSSTFKFQLGAALFGTSRETMRRLEGDCSEAAVLTAALLRAAGIPSRVVLGFATLGRGVFIGHAWTEARVNDRWMGVDAALREFPAGAERLMLLRLDGSEDMRVAASNLMLKAMANLDIEIETAWSREKLMPLTEHPGNAAEAQAFFEEILRGIGE